MKPLKHYLVLCLMLILTLAVVSCNQENVQPTGDNVGAFGSYEALKEYITEMADKADNQYYFGGMWLENDVATAEDSVDYTQAPATEERDYSKTNNQVEGVEESDRILTDGYKIYIISGQTFFIVDADTLAIDYQMAIEDGYMNGLYLYQDRIVLVSNVWHYYETTCTGYYWEDRFYPEDDYVGDWSSDDETVTSDDETTTNETTTVTKETTLYTYTCYRYSYGTQIQILDVEDTTDVTIERELYFDSSYLIDSRMIDDQLFLVMNNHMYDYGFNDDFFVPLYKDSVVSDELMMIPANNIYFMPNDGESFGFLTLATLSVTDDEAATVKAYLGSTYQIYMSQNNLYTVVHKWNYIEATRRYEHFTFILRFEIEADELVYKAIASVEGSPLNQFSMDEHDGVFRIATTGYSFSDDDEWQIDNYMFLLDATSDDEMTQISFLSGLGKPGERIYAARFAGDIAYVVTFEQIDPLYKLDLSDPENPFVAGELEEEGVSDYLHIISDDLMLGVGRQAETDGEWTRFIGVKVALYDTTGNDPVNLDTYLVEGSYSYTNVMWDHKALLTFTPSGENFTYIGIPIYEYYDSWHHSSQNVYLFKVGHEGTLALLTKLTHMEINDQGYYQYFDSIERTVMIDNYVYTVSYSSIHMFDMNDGFSEVGETELNPSYYEVYGYPESTDAVEE